MAVHSHVFRPYEGVRTSTRNRWTVVARYALAEALAAKRTIVLLVAAAFPLLGGAVIIYLHHNLEAVKILEIPVDALVRIDSQFFFRILVAQAFAALAEKWTLEWVAQRDSGPPATTTEGA